MDNPQTDSKTNLLSIFKGYLLALWGILFLMIVFFFFGDKILSESYYLNTSVFLTNTFDTNFFVYCLVGFFAQVIDGSLGMAYGVSSTSFLLSTGVSPAVASASVHVAEVFTTGASGFSHWKFGNIDKKLFLKLLLPGSIGAAIGAFLLTSIDGNDIKPFVSIYLGVMGIIIIIKAFKKVILFKDHGRVSLLALIGGFVDNIGGGGWGPVVTTTLISSGGIPRYTVGSVNAAEFFVSLTGATVFTITIGIDHWNIIAGLIAGGLIAAPVGAFLCSRINPKILMIIVGVLIVFLSIRTVFLSVI
ncbi:MAG TPA: sulfite exporter TauE/SafE family protein [Ignavibacteria bacterium]|nr:sulfite exporter TauE/SafE family protein [Ignavibacteria bacterium]